MKRKLVKFSLRGSKFPSMSNTYICRNSPFNPQKILSSLQTYKNPREKKTEKKKIVQTIRVLLKISVPIRRINILEKTDSIPRIESFFRLFFQSGRNFSDLLSIFFYIHISCHRDFSSNRIIRHFTMDECSLRLDWMENEIVGRASDRRYRDRK